MIFRRTANSLRSLEQYGVEKQIIMYKKWILRSGKNIGHFIGICVRMGCIGNYSKIVCVCVSI